MFSLVSTQKIDSIMIVEVSNSIEEKMLLVGWLSHKKQGLIAKVEGMR